MPATLWIFELYACESVRNTDKTKKIPLREAVRSLTFLRTATEIRFEQRVRCGLQHPGHRAWLILNAFFQSLLQNIQDRFRKKRKSWRKQIENADYDFAPSAFETVSENGKDPWIFLKNNSDVDICSVDMLRHLLVADPLSRYTTSLIRWQNDINNTNRYRFVHTGKEILAHAWMTPREDWM